MTDWFELAKIICYPERETTISDLQKEHSREETMRPETKPIQCSHCKGYHPDDEIDCKPMCYACKENLDDYRRVMNQRNLFLSIIKEIRTTYYLTLIHNICDGILAQYKEE